MGKDIIGNVNLCRSTKVEIHVFFRYIEVDMNDCYFVLLMQPDISSQTHTHTHKTLYYTNLWMRLNV